MKRKILALIGILAAFFITSKALADGPYGELFPQSPTKGVFRTPACGTIGSTTSPDLDLRLNTDLCFTDTIDTGTTTYTFSNPPASGTKGGFTLILTNGGSQTINWPGSVDWEGGTAPTLTTTGVDLLYFFTIDGGATWYGFTGGLDFQ